MKDSSDAVGKSVTDSIDTITAGGDTAGVVDDVTASVMDAVNGVTAAVTDRLAKENLPGREVHVETCRVERRVQSVLLSA